MLMRLLAVAITLLIARSNSSNANETALPKPEQIAKLVVHPTAVVLKSRDDSTQLVVTATLRDGRLQDLTHAVKFAVVDLNSSITLRSIHTLSTSRKARISVIFVEQQLK